MYWSMKKAHGKSRSVASLLFEIKQNLNVREDTILF